MTGPHPPACGACRALIERAPDPADRRRNVITITPDGRRHLRQLDKLIATIQDDLLAPLTQPERDQLVRLLARLLDHHARAAPQPTGDPGPRHSAGLSESSR